MEILNKIKNFVAEQGVKAEERRTKQNKKLDQQIEVEEKKMELSKKKGKLKKLREERNKKEFPSLYKPL